MLKMILDLITKSILIKNKKHDSMYVDSEGLAWPYNSKVPPHETLEEAVEEKTSKTKKQ